MRTLSLPLRLRRRTWLSIAALLSLTSCRAAPVHPGGTIGLDPASGARDLYEFAERQRAAHQLPALGVGIIRDGRVLGIGVAGERRLGSADWATIADGFDVASCAKSITAAIAAMLVASGQVRWDTTVEQAFPQLADSILPIYRKVTLDMLLRHRSGLARWMSTNERWAAWHRDHISKSAIEKRRLFVAKVFSDPPRAAPGTETYYVNDGYVVAAAMLEAATGRPWEAYVRDVLFAPMSLESMRYGVPVRGEDRGVVWGHAPRSFSGPLAMRPDPDEYGDPPFGSPAGFLYSTVPDLLRYLDLHIQGANGASALLGREEFDYLHTPLAGERFALGWEVETTRDADGRVLERSIYHGGFSGRARANLWFSPESRSGTVIVYNYGGDEKADAYAAIFFALLKEFATPIQSHALSIVPRRF